MITFIGLVAMVILVATIAGLRYTTRQLELAQLKSSFVSNVTHELKTPIALIRLAVETLELRRFSTPEEGESFLAGIVRETKRLQQLVDNILDFARLEAGQARLRLESVDLAQLARETVENFRPRLEQQGFRLETRPAGGAAAGAGRRRHAAALPAQPARQRPQVLARAARGEGVGRGPRRRGGGLGDAIAASASRRRTRSASSRSSSGWRPGSCTT